MSQSGTSELSHICEHLWDNWANPENTDSEQTDDENLCRGCPAHYSNRTDYPERPKKEENWHGYKPFFGLGKLTDVEVVLLAEEPGKPNNTDDTNYTEKSYRDVRRNNNWECVADGLQDANTLSTLVDILNGDAWNDDEMEGLESEFRIYFTQVKKCNERADETGIGSEVLNHEAQCHCSGIGAHAGYLMEEIRAADPEYVIGLGKDTYSLFSALYDVDPLDDPDNFSTAIAAGNSGADSEMKSGIRFLSVNDEEFDYIPTGHPSYGLHSQTLAEANIDEADAGRNKTETYYKRFAEDLIKRARR